MIRILHQAGALSIRPHQLALLKQQRRHQRVYAILNAYFVPWLVSFVGDIAKPVENVSIIRIG